MNECRPVLLLCAGLLLVSASVSGAPPMLDESYGNIEGAWRFQTDPGDIGLQERWFARECDDAAWRTLDVPGYWEAQGVTDPRPGQPPKPKDGMPWSDYDGVAWYRFHFLAPDSWVDQNLVLSLGSVDDEDRVYLNGQLVGETGPSPQRSVLVRRRYTIPAGLLRAGEENVLAVRVLDGGGPGGIVGPLLTLLPEERMRAMTMLPSSDRPLDARFNNPPAASRILKIVHMLPDAPEAQDELVQSLVSQGFGGMATNVSFENYMESETKWASFERTVREAKQAGMALWLYDERGYPSGNAGGITLREHLEWQARGLYIADTLLQGGPVSLDMPPGALVRAVALPVASGVAALDQAVDLAAQIRDGKLAWDAPAGSWHVVAVTEDYLHEGTHAAVSLADKLPYINLLMPEPTARFIEATHGAYAKRLGDDLGQFFTATFTDEPSLMSMFMRPQPWRVLPWAPNLSAEFARRRGYPLEPLIPALVAEAGPKGQAARYDFWLTVGELVSENYFGQIQTWCREHNIPSGGHLLLEEPILTHVPLYGDFFRCARRLDAPSIDCLTSIPEQVPWYVARLISSIAELEGRPVTMCETSDHSQRYRPAGDDRPIRDVTEDEIRGTCNLLQLNGITTITSYYSFAGLSTEQLVRLNTWIGRCGTMIEGGHQVCDVALLYPIESIWPKFAPSHNWTSDAPVAAQRIETAYREASTNLFSSRRDFTYVDGQALCEAEVDNGVLRHGALEWRVVVLPCADTLPLKAWENLAAFWRTGGAVVALSALPANSEREFPSPRVQALAQEMFRGAEAGQFTVNAAGGVGVYLPQGSEALLPLVMDALITPDVAVADAEAPVRVTHRRIDGHEVYFVINDSADAWQGDLTFAAAGAGEQWDPETGLNTPLDGPGPIPAALGPYDGLFFRFAEAGPARRLPAVSGTLPGLTLSSLPEAPVSVGKGEFVEAKLTPAQLDGVDGWQAEAVLTKSDVDTFLFASFAYPTPVDLSGAACLVLDTVVPEGQRTSTSLLIILRDANGVEYVGHTGRPLGALGPCRGFVPMRSFERAGWSKGPEGPLNRSAIASINIGWGGYLGKEGETVTFTMTPLQQGCFVK